jgi:hypothetical protein
MAMNPGLAAYMKNKQAMKNTQIAPSPGMPMPATPKGGAPGSGKTHSKVVHNMKGKC